MPTRPTRIIRTVDDLAAVPQDDLAKCMTALRQAIAARKKIHADAIAGGRLPPDTPFRFEQFEWHPKRTPLDTVGGVVSLDTPIRELPIRRRARDQLQELGVVRLADVGEVTELELRCCKDVGGTTVALLRDLLRPHGLSFAAPQDPVQTERQQARHLARLSGEERASAMRGMADTEPVWRLGLRPRTLERAKANGWATVGALREARWNSLVGGLGRSELAEVIEAVRQTGEGLRCDPSKTDLWRAGLVNAAELERPTDDATPVASLRPWIGAVADRLLRAGVRNLGQLKGQAKAGRLLHINGVGPDSAQRVLGFLGELAGRPAAELTIGPPGAVNSVFALRGEDNDNAT